MKFKDIYRRKQREIIGKVCKLLRLIAFIDFSQSLVIEHFRIN